MEQAEKKKKKLDSTVTDLEREGDQLALDAEKQNKMSMLVKSNALRSKAKEKRMELEAEKQKIKDLFIYSSIWNIWHIHVKHFALTI